MRTQTLSNERQLSRAYRRILSAAALAPLALGAGCGVDTSGFSSAKCGPMGSIALDPLHSSAPYEYIELRRQFEGSGGTPTVAETAGVKCQSARDMAACQGKVASATSTSTTGIYTVCFDACNTYYVVLTQGDTVTVIDTPEAWKTFLGAVDTEAEAQLTAWTAGYGISCTDKDRGAVRGVEGGFEVVGTRGTGCGASDDIKQYLLFVSPTGTVTVRSEYVLKRGDPGCAIGRRPAGLCGERSRRRAGGRRAVGRFYARAARLEAASVNAFRVLREELRAHGAPAQLLALSDKAADDEIRHAVVTARLARRYGARPIAARVEPRPLRPLESIALENAVEGCVREAFGALVACYQAEHAADPVIADAMRTIAADETRHAALAFRVDAWARRRLGADARARVATAQAAAIATLRAELQDPPETELCTQAGLPTAEQALRLLAEAEQTLWRAA